MIGLYRTWYVDVGELIYKYILAYISACSLTAAGLVTGVMILPFPARVSKNVSNALKPNVSPR